MGLNGRFKFGKRNPGLNRTPPPKEEWSSHVKSLDPEGFDDFIGKYPVSLIDFYSPICGPCKTMASRLRPLSKEYKHKVAFGKINVARHHELAKKYKIMRVPNIIVFSYGKKVTSMVGIKSISILTKTLDDVLSDLENE
jgi:thioredoxin 1